MIIALIYDWRVALVGLFFVPLIISSNLILMKLQKNENFDKNDEAFNLLLESMINIRTILSCSKEQLTKKYN
jgi:ABC-type bacteriocin/lantibiotic exporter with double-glycine peptidase domain